MTTPDVLTVARGFRRWAIDHGLKERGLETGATGGAAEGDEAPRSGADFGLTAAGAGVLQRRLISLIAVQRRARRILVFTHKRATLAERKLLPEALAGVEVAFLHGGPLTAQIGPGLGAGYHQSSVGAYCCGGSIHPARYAGAGTLGALVRDKAGQLYGLTNNHVSGDCNYADVDTPILAPGHADIHPRGIDPFTIGYHHATLPMVSGSPDNVNAARNSDAAIFRIKDPATVSSLQGAHHDTPTTTLAMHDGLAVEKVGRSTGLRQGQVLAQVVGFEPCLYTIHHLSGSKALVYYDSPFMAVGLPGGERFSEPGDSGSLVTALKGGQRKAVGLLFAGNAEGHTFVLPIEPILSGLKVSLVAGHNL